MELRDLEYFLACVETGSFTAAARRSHAAQPTISHALGRLEREVGEKLLDRSPRSPVRPTDAGELLVQHARRALGAIASFKESLSELRGELRGVLRVAAIPSLCVTLVPRALSLMANTHPHVQVSVRTLAAEKIARAIASAREDIGLVAGAPGAALRGLEVEELYSERFVLVVRRDHPLSRRTKVTFSSLREQPLLLPPSGTFTSSIIHDACELAGFEPQVRLTLASAEALREATRARLGAAILPRGYLLERDPDLKSIELVRPTPTRRVLLVRRPETAASTPRVARAFISAVQRIAQKTS